MKVISFLGTGNYQQTIFFYNGQEYQTRFFPAAVAQFLRPDKLMLIITSAVFEHNNFKSLKDELNNFKINWNVIKIPEGRSESELWEIFDILTSAVEENEAIVFDITHSFRSLPFLSFLAVAYLKAARHVTVQKVIYGAYEARDIEENRSPVFDLTPFVSLLDWLSATTRFIETGDGQPLADLLKTGIPSSNLLMHDQQARTIRDQLNAAAKAIETASLSLRVTRPIETMESTALIEETLKNSLSVIQEKAKPFSVLTQKVIDEYGQFALTKAKDESKVKQNLTVQLKMVEWYLNRRRIIQAVTLLREWVVSLLCWNLDEPMFEYKKGRKHVEQALNNAVERRKSKPEIRNKSRCDEALEALPEIDKLVKLWDKITDIRNDIAHVGMRNNPKSAASLESNAQKVYNSAYEIGKKLLGWENE